MALSVGEAPGVLARSSLLNQVMVKSQEVLPWRNLGHHMISVLHCLYVTLQLK